MPPITKRLVKGIELTWQELDNNFDFLDRNPAVVLTISGGLITVTGPGLYRLETEGAASTDDLTGITGGFGHEWPIILTLNTAGRVITVKHTPPNLLLLNGADFLLNSLNDSIPLRDRTSAIWREVGGRVSIP
jgi:hypothetical protein